MGFIQLPFRYPKIAVWQGTGNTCLTLLCEPQENRLLAESVLKTLVKFLQEHLRLLQNPTEVLNKPERLEIILNRFLPEGNLVCMNHRVVRQLEKEVDVKIKS